jgi:hypothetical protein
MLHATKSFCITMLQRSMDLKKEPKDDPNTREVHPDTMFDAGSYPSLNRIVDDSLPDVEGSVVGATPKNVVLAHAA